jgi:hypothetical protein
MKKLNLLVEYALNVVYSLNNIKETERKHEAFNIVRCRLEGNDYINYKLNNYGSKIICK